ncbi:bile acid:sodium symporter [Parerythrobacter aurantius]|uniref:bile acid:sodium symporter n=1 Tax=Parerythrobacter aurantius TaxID=3127706 RepID=UPI003255D363
MLRLLGILRDPMIAVLAVATFGALAIPATGSGKLAASWISSAGIFLLFYLNGLRIRRSDIAAGLRNWRFFLPLALWVFGIMALLGLGFSYWAAQWLPASIALGFLFLGALPSTVQSATSYTVMAGGNVSLAVIGAALLNIAGVVISAPLFAVLGGGVDIAFDTGVILRVAALLLLPFVLGQAMQGWFGGWIERHRSQTVWLDRIVIGLAVYVALSGAVEQGIASTMDASTWAGLVTLVVLYLVAAHAGAWLAGGALGFLRPDRIAFLFSASQKSVAVGAPLAALLLPANAAGFVLAPLLLYHLLQLVAAAPLAASLARGGTS